MASISRWPDASPRPRSEAAATPMKQIPELPVTLRVGGALNTLECKPLAPYSTQAMEFMAALSKALLALPAARQYPDIAAFGYWCRAANLAKLAREFGTQYPRIGRGLVLHIAPANVPVNFAFSFAFGLLAGNANIVRIPERDFPQVEIICDEIARLFALPVHSRLAAMNRLIKYPRDDEITGALSVHCQARMLWGGDSTIAHLRKLPAHPRSVDIAFADRYSFCLMQAEAVLRADERAIAELARGFFNDVFLLDQNACSSPHLVIWQGDEEQAAKAQDRFWPTMASYLQQRYEIAPIYAVDKFVNLCRTADRLPQASGSTRHDNLIYRVSLDALPSDIERHRGQYGFFYEYVTADLGCLAGIVGERYQTLTSFGIDRDALVRFIIDEGLTGIDRVVPVGRALDMGAIWDGYNLVQELSRIVSTA
ncbi:acyl-CoA reductase [Rhizobium sp. S9]|nr:acyl-CoA reductase [Rhizobium sp. S9]